MVHCPETYSYNDNDEDDDDDEDEDDEEDEDDQDDQEDDVEDDEDDVVITSGLQHSLKIRNYGENECSISDEHVSSVGGGSQSIKSRPVLFKSITKLSFDGVHRQPVLGQSMIGPVLNLHRAAPPREDSL
jgi:hypothetical protein